MANRFTHQEWRLLGNCLNEVLNGFLLPDFAGAIGSENTARSFLAHLHTLSPHGTVSLSHEQLAVARNAVRETIRELGHEEFQTRTGDDLQTGEALLNKLDHVLAEAEPNAPEA